MKLHLIHQKLLKYTVFITGGVTLVLLSYAIFCRIKQITPECINLSEVKLLSVGKLETTLTLKLTPYTEKKRAAEIFYAKFDKNLSGSIWRSSKNTFHITVRGISFWSKYHVPYNISGDTDAIKKLFDAQRPNIF